MDHIVTFHTTRQSSASGSTAGTATSPRIAVSLPPEDMACLTWWAAKKGVPVADVLRSAVWSYLMPVRADFEKERNNP